MDSSSRPCAPSELCPRQAKVVSGGHDSLERHRAAGADKRLKGSAQLRSGCRDEPGMTNWE